MEVWVGVVLFVYIVYYCVLFYGVTLRIHCYAHVCADAVGRNFVFHVECGVDGRVTKW